MPFAQAGDVKLHYETFARVCRFFSYRAPAGRVNRGSFASAGVRRPLPGDRL